MDKEMTVFQFRIEKDRKKEWQKYCLEHDITLTELIKSAVDRYLLINK